MKVLTNKQMRVADGYTIEKIGVPSLTLMERAGIALADEAESFPRGKVVCVCGGGNNGGDGFVCARILRERGHAVDVVCIAEKFSEDCCVNKEKWLSLGGEIYKDIPDKAYAVIVDCLFGTGFHGKLEGKNEELVRAVNSLTGKVLSADIPSGVNGDNGIADGIAVNADRTLCIGERKLGCYLNDGIDYAGEIKRADIGIFLPEEGYARLLTKAFVSSLLNRRKRNSHKGSYGKAAIVAGSMEYTGAAYLSAAACLRSGAGYTALYLPKQLFPLFALKLPETLLSTTNEGGRYAFNEESMRSLQSYNSVAYGMGMGISEEVYLGAKWLIENYEGKLLLDADGLNSLARYGGNLSALFAKKKGDVILTPHVLEFSRLTGKSKGEILEEGVSLAKAYAKAWGVTLVLKGAVSIIADGERTFLNDRGNSGQAKGGSGDLLSGLVCGLAAGTSTFNAAVAGCYLAGVSAELAARERGEYSLTASDCIEYLGKAFLFVTENADENCRE